MASSGTLRSETAPATAAAPISSNTTNLLRTEKSMMRLIMGACTCGSARPGIRPPTGPQRLESASTPRYFLTVIDVLFGAFSNFCLQSSEQK